MATIQDLLRADTLGRIYDASERSENARSTTSTHPITPPSQQNLGAALTSPPVPGIDEVRAEPSKGIVWPQSIPEQLLEQLREVKNDKVALEAVLVRGCPALYRSKTTGSSYEHTLCRTGEKLEVTGYNVISLLFSLRTRATWVTERRSVIVATGPSFERPVILGYRMRLQYSCLNVWRGRTGFDERAAVKRSCPRRLGPRRLLQSVSSPQETPQELERSNRASQGGSDVSHFPYWRPRVESSNDVNQPAAKPTSGPLSKEYPYNGFGPEVDMPDQTDDDEVKIIECRDTHNTTRKPWAVNREPYRIEEQEVLFINSKGTTIRQRLWTQCNTVDRMFLQAKTAGIIDPSQKSTLLSARIDDAELLLTYGDSHDFRILQDMVDTEAGWGTSGNKETCKIEIRAV